MKTFLAIDFGTSQTSVAMLTESSRFDPEIVEINGQKAIPTALQLDENGKVLYFGREAREKFHQQSSYTFYNFKAFIGSDLTYQDRDKTYTPEDLSLIFLTCLRQELEKRYFNGATLTEQADLSCTIGCPVEWNEQQKGTLEALAQKAGFPRVVYCDEPWGIIYYYRFRGDLDLRESQNVLVYDFGGGMTNVVIERVHAAREKRINPQLLTVSGITDLGGMSFDSVLFDFFMKKLNLDRQALPLRDLQAIERYCRMLKEDLSYNIDDGASSAEVSIPLLSSTRMTYTLSLTKEEFESICADYIKRFDGPIFEALNTAGLMIERIDHVILTGGSSVMPYVREHIGAIFPKEKILMSASPIEVVAKGLAIYGRVCSLGPESLMASASSKTEQVPVFEQYANPAARIPNRTAERKKGMRGKFIAAAVIVLFFLVKFFILEDGKGTPNHTEPPAQNGIALTAEKDELSFTEPVQTFRMITPLDSRMDGNLHRFYFLQDVIPARTYTEVNHNTTPTLAVMTILVCDAALSDDLVYEITKTIFEHIDEFKNLQEMKGSSLDMPLKGDSIPLHPGAAKYYREQGMAVPKR